MSLKFTAADIPHAHLTMYQKHAAALAINKLLNGDTFYISDLKEILELFRLTLDPEEQNVMRMLHCVEYRDMEPYLASELKRKILIALGMGDNIIDGTFSEVNEASPAGKKGILSRLGLTG